LPSSLVQVVAGVLERDGRLLICQRHARDRYALKWEFPGGKVEPGEDPRAALARELKEELAIEAAVGEELLRYEYCYPQRTPILLMFFRVEGYQGELRNRQFAAVEWETPARLAEYDFVEGDRQFVARLAGGEVATRGTSPRAGSAAGSWSPGR
jgi:8-oxo-dGTP diphosphatase